MNKRISASMNLVPSTILVFFSLTTLAQQPARKEPLYKPPTTTTTSAYSQPIIDAAGYRAADSVEARLVSLALGGPQLRAADDQNRINEYTLRNARQAWMNLLTFTLNLNELDFQKSTPGATYLYPKYFFGLTIPLGTLFSRTQVKAAREQIKIGNETQIQLTRQIRTQVLQRYRTYKTKRELLRLQIQVTDDEQAEFLQVEKNYRDGTVPLEAHIMAQEKYNIELVKRMNLQLELDEAKLDVEELIGTNLESVTNY